MTLSFQGYSRQELHYKRRRYTARTYMLRKTLLQYAVVRACQPKIIVETGVANGVSSAYILLALQANGGGTLYSVGLNDPEYLPAGKPLGWVVPQEFRSKWKLLVGDS